MQRILTGITIGVAWLLLLLFAHFPLLAGDLLLGPARPPGIRGHAAGSRRWPKLRPLVISAGLLPVLAAGSAQPAPVLGALLIALCGLLLLTILRYGSWQKPLFFLLTSSFGVFYLGLLTRPSAPAHGP
jgi:phosphatidate cytidylyltransferase